MRKQQFPLSSSQKDGAFDLLHEVDSARSVISGLTSNTHKAAFGQFFTPSYIARPMAAMFYAPPEHVKLLDPGAGIGALSVAFILACCNREQKPLSLTLTAVELDDALIPQLQTTLEKCSQLCRDAHIQFAFEIMNQDFLEFARQAKQDTLFSQGEPSVFNCIILNPPYKKINSNSKARKLLRLLGVETSNIYTGFLAVAIQLLEPNGELVAITPRSFCNGTYFRSFRQFLLKTCAIRRIHVYESRELAFQDDDVLQENIIIHLKRGRHQQQEVVISASHNPLAALHQIRILDFHQVVDPLDKEAFIHIPSNEQGHRLRTKLAKLPCVLADLEINVSTGRVVDFRAKEYVQFLPNDHTSPLIYPSHLNKNGIVWPKIDGRKPNAISNAARGKDLLIPNANYVLVKRFSTKEEARRIVATLYQQEQFAGDFVGFENHLNYFHQHGDGLPLLLAKGLTAFLNATVVDETFRQFSGHTQVNATDLRNLRYPTLQQLEAIGAKIPVTLPEQAELDSLVEAEIFFDE